MRSQIIMDDAERPWNRDHLIRHSLSVFARAIKVVVSSLALFYRVENLAVHAGTELQ